MKFSPAKEVCYIASDHSLMNKLKLRVYLTATFPGVYLLAAVLAIEVLSFAIKAKVMTINSKPVVME